MLTYSVSGTLPVVALLMLVSVVLRAASENTA